MRRASICVAVTLLAACSSASTTATATVVGDSTLVANATLVRVVDGDTIDVTIEGGRERVRLIGIDTPETVKQDTPVECFGPEASAFTRTMLPEGSELYLERDVEARDDYGRLLAYVYRVDDGTFVNLAIVREGFAQPLTIPPNVAHSAEFVGAARDAHDADLGLWARCAG